MGVTSESAEAASKLISSLKDTPLWLLLGLAVAADMLLLVPALQNQIPPTFRGWIVVAAMVFSVLAVFRALGLVGMWARGFAQARAARRTFHLTAESGRSWWGLARQRDDTMMTQISVHLLAKNLTAAPLGLTGVRLVKPKFQEVANAHLLVRAAKHNMYGSAEDGYAIPPKRALPVSIHIMARGTPKQAPSEKLLITLAITDDEGNEQRLTLRLRGTARSSPEPKVPLEQTSAIADPIAKEVASVLQSEIGRYDKNGREGGGFGSLHIVYRGREVPQMGSDSWSPSPKNQSIVEDPENAALHSDNLTALLALHKCLKTDSERASFIAALLDRLDDKKGYLGVSYFIVCVLWKIGRLGDALAKAKTLPEDEMKVFGLSNVLYMLNGLLRYRHPDFTREMLDSIDAFIHSLTKEHTFHVLDKIAAVRALRLRIPAGAA